MNTFQRRQRLLDWLETIRAEVQHLILDQHLFWEIQAIIGGNPKFGDASGIFNQWMKSSFVQATAIGVRCQVKSGDDSVSLQRLLLEVRANPSLVSRQYYLSLFADDSDLLKEVADEEFDSIAGKGADELPTICVDEQIRRLKAVVGTIEHYVDRRIAHYDQRGLARPEPRLRDLEDALKVLENLVLLYWRLLKGHSPDLLPMVPPEWKGVFTFHGSNAARTASRYNEIRETEMLRSYLEERR